MKAHEQVRSAVLGPGARLHVLSTRRFTTTWCRVALVRDLGAEATATALLASCLQAATARSPTREALAERLADLYGASLSVSVAKTGDASLLFASLEWPARAVGGRGAPLASGLAFLREVLTAPVRAAGGSDLDPGIVALEAQNHVRSLLALQDDRAHYALRRCLSVTCRGEPYGLDVLGRVEDVPAATPAALGRLHGRLIARAPVEILLAGDVAPAGAARAVRRHLLWDGRASRIGRMPRVVGVQSAPSRPRRIEEEKEVQQSRLVLAWRAAIRPSSPLLPAGLVLAGVLGGGSYGRLFRVLREERGLCYDAHASWHPAKGLLTVEAGVEPDRVPEAIRVIRALVREMAHGRVDPVSRQGFLQAVRSRVATLADDRSGMMGTQHEALLLGVDPSPERLRRAMEAVDARALARLGRRLGPATTYVLCPRGGAG